MLRDTLTYHPEQAQLLVQCVPWHVGCNGFARDRHGCGDAPDGFFASGGCQRHSVYNCGTLWKWSRSGVMFRGDELFPMSKSKPNVLEPQQTVDTYSASCYVHFI